MSKKQAKKQRKRSQRISVETPSIVSDYGKFRALNLECNVYESKRYNLCKPPPNMGSNKGLYEYVKPKSGVIIKRQQYKVYSLT